MCNESAADGAIFVEVGGGDTRCLRCVQVSQASNQLPLQQTGQPGMLSLASGLGAEDTAQANATLEESGGHGGFGGAPIFPPVHDTPAFTLTNEEVTALAAIATSAC